MFSSLVYKYYFPLLGLDKAGLSITTICKLITDEFKANTEKHLTDSRAIGILFSITLKNPILGVLSAYPNFFLCIHPNFPLGYVIREAPFPSSGYKRVNNTK